MLASNFIHFQYPTKNLKRGRKPAVIFIIDVDSAGLTLRQHEMGGPSNPPPFSSTSLSLPFLFPLPPLPLEVGPLKYS